MKRTHIESICWLTSAAVLLLCHVGPAHAEVTRVTLPDDYADFAINPDSGDIVALSTAAAQAVLFRESDKEKTPAATLRVGSTPCSVCFKRFGNQTVFAVVCSQDSHMYVIDAKTFELVKKVELAGAGVSNVTSSINPEDPFLYYNYGGGHDSEAGAVSLRDMRNHGTAFDDSMDCAISADGTIAYRRGPWSPSGFESLILTNSLSDEKPIFARLFYDHTSTGQYLPDPFQRFTATGKGIFTVSLEKREAELDFYPQCFFSTKPLIVGTASFDRPMPGRPSGANEVVLRAASYNTFASVGDAVKLSLGPSADDASLPRGIPSQGDFKRVTRRSRTIADDKRDRVVYAARNNLFYIPLADFNLPDEPFLLAELEGPRRLVINQPAELRLVPKDSRVEIVVEDLPDGMELSGKTLRWKPAADQIGTAKIVVTLKHGDIQRMISFTRDVDYPSIELPFAASGLAVDPAARHAVIWEGPQIDRYGRPSTPATGPVNVAVVDLATGKTKAQRKLAEQIGRLVVSESHIFLQTSATPSRCDALKIADLERAKTLSTPAPINNVHTVGKLLILETQTGAEIYDAQTLDKRRSFGTTVPGSSHAISFGNNPSTILKSQGIFFGGILYDLDLKPSLVVAHTGLPELSGADTRLKQAPFLAPMGSPHTTSNMPYHPSSSGRSTLATKPLLGSDVTVTLEQPSQQIQVAGATHTWRTQFELVLAATGEVNARQIIQRSMQHARTATTPVPSRPVLEVAAGEALVAVDTHLYRWPINVPSNAASTVDPKLTLLPRQSTLALSGKGKTILEHTAQGGKEPRQFSLITPYEDAMSIDADTGRLTIDEDKLLPDIESTVQTFINRNTRGTSFVETLRDKAPPMIESATAILGRPPKGVPVAVPIRVDVRDDALAIESLQYYLVAELPSAPLVAKLQELDKERQMAQLAAQNQRPTENPQAGLPALGAPNRPQNVADLTRRVDNLEQRIDLLTRQLNTLIKQIEQQQEEESK